MRVSWSQYRMMGVKVWIILTVLTPPCQSVVPWNRTARLGKGRCMHLTCWFDLGLAFTFTHLTQLIKENAPCLHIRYLVHFENICQLFELVVTLCLLGNNLRNVAKTLKRWENLMVAFRCLYSSQASDRLNNLFDRSEMIEKITIHTI